MLARDYKAFAGSVEPCRNSFACEIVILALVLASFVVCLFYKTPTYKQTIQQSLVQKATTAAVRRKTQPTRVQLTLSLYMLLEAGLVHLSMLYPGVN